MMYRIQHKPSRSRQRQLGVTLLELMITVVIIAVLAAIAIPNYRAYSQRSHRTEAKSALLRVQTQQERFYLDNDRFASSFAAGELDMSDESENGVYELALSTTDGWADDFTATATPKAGGGTNGVDQTTDTDCTSFSINSEGVRTASSTECW